jgi:hypothetical protein
MILLSDNVAWVKMKDGVCVSLDTVRLSDSILRAATLAGHGDWWLAEAVAEAVREFVCVQCDRRTVPVGELSDLVAGVLGSLGYTLIAEAYRRRCEYVEIRLDCITGASELEFFCRLDSALRVADKSELALVEVRGLRSCVMRLRGARHWSNGCRLLAQEIVGHVRERVAQVRPRNATELRLTVVA